MTEKQIQAKIAELKRKRSVIPATNPTDYQSGLIHGLTDAIKLLGGE